MSGGARKNFLVVVADQLTATVLGERLGGAAPAASAPLTPHLDRLAARGVTFTNAYTNSPLCGPARGAFMTGLLPSRSGIYDNASAWPADVPTFGHRLRLAGYRTILAGKMHFIGAEQLHGFEERLTTDIYPADFSWVPDWSRPDHRPDWYHSMDSVLNAGPVVRSNQIDFDEEVAYAARRKLFDLARDRVREGADTRPFCMLVSFTHPHDPFNIEHRWWDLYAERTVPMPRVGVSHDVHPADLRVRMACGVDADPVTAEQVLRARRAYFGAVSYVDHHVGVLIETLEAAGLAADTTVVFTSDHGEMLGEHGLWYKMSFLEGASRVPLVIVPAGGCEGRREGMPVSLLDIGETLCALAGQNDDRNDGWQTDGRSLVPWLGEGAARAPADVAVYGEYLGEGTDRPATMIRRGRWKFIHAPGDPDRLFDITADPDETRDLAGDLAGDPAHAAVMAAFRAEARRQWDYDAITTQVLASQRRRALVARALATGRCTSWDYQPPPTAHHAYIRNHRPIENLEASARL